MIESDVYALNLWKDTKTQKDALKKLVKEGIISAYPMETVTKSGETKQILLNAALLDLGSKNWAIESWIDITEQKQAENELRESEERFRSLFENMPIGVYRSTPGGQILEANPAFAKMLGYPQVEELLTVNVLDIFENPDDRELELSQLGDEDNVNHFELQLHQQDGNVIWVRDVFQVVRDRDGQILYFEGSLENITERKQAELALRESEEKYRLLVENIPNVVWTTDNDGVTTYISPIIDRIYGYTQDEIYKNPDLWFERIHPDDVVKVKEAFEATLRGESTFNIEYRIQRKDGNWIWLHDKAILIQEEGGGKIVQGVFEDITERVQAELALKESEEKVKTQVSFLDSVMDNSPFAMWISDPTGTVIRTNNALRKALNLTDEQILGKYNVLKDDNLDEQGVMPQARAVFKEQVPARFSIPWVGSKAGAEDFEGASDLWIDVSMFPVLDEEGNLTNVVCQWVDITEHKQAEETLHESEELFAKSLINIPVGIVLTSHNLQFFSANPAFCQMLGYTEEEMSSRTFLDVTHPDHRDTDRENIEKMWQGKFSYYQTEKRYIAKNGDIIWGNLTTSIIQDQDGKPLYALAIIEEISNRKRAQENLQESEALLRTIAENYPNSYLSIIENDLTVGFTSGQEFKKQKLNPDQFVGMTLEQLFGDQAPVVRGHYLSTFAGKEQSFEILFMNQHMRASFDGDLVGQICWQVLRGAQAGALPSYCTNDQVD